MTIADMLLPEFDQEMAGTRKVLERVPEGKLDWRSHAKSNTIGWVTRHLAEIPGWTNLTLAAPSFDINPPGGEKYCAVHRDVGGEDSGDVRRERGRGAGGAGGDGR